MTVNYLTESFSSVTATEETPRYGMTQDGYTCQRGAPTQYMVTLHGSQRKYRVMCYCISNIGSLFINKGGERHYLTAHQEGQLTLNTK